MKKTLIIILVVLLVIVGGYFLFGRNKTVAPTTIEDIENNPNIPPLVGEPTSTSGASATSSE